MRNLGPIAAMTLLASCGSQETGNASASDTEPRTQALNEAVAAAPLNQVAAVEDADATAEATVGTVSACLMQGKDRLDVPPIRAIGTEPFWSARVDGRCVTYSTPENQQGIRVWTRYAPGADGGGGWTGKLGGKSFELRTRPAPGCSDGMSDKTYPIAVELTVDREKRRGCAEPQ